MDLIRRSIRKGTDLSRNWDHGFGKEFAIVDVVLKIGYQIFIWIVCYNNILGAQYSAEEARQTSPGSKFKHGFIANYAFGVLLKVY